MAERSEQRRILVIDDDPDFLEFVSIILKSAGHRVMVASTVSEGLRAMRADPPHLVVADVMMSLSLDGLFIDRQMARDPRLSDIPLLLVSAIVSEADAAVSRRLETRRYAGLMHKPVQPGELLRRVAEITAQQ
jgi:CheY-like chemotaxis protein